MSDPTANVPDAEVQPATRSLWERVSIVWLVPLGALLLALALAYQAYSDRGSLIEITFANGSGIAAGETDLRYRDIAVGSVERVGFTDGLDRVVVTVRIDEQVEPYIDADAEFWVVRPEVTAQGVQGLSTVLSGVYIEGSWDSGQGPFVDRHTGLDDAPIARPDQEGTRIVLRTESGRGLTAGAPILLRGLEVGRVGTPRLASDGISVLAEAFIFAPHADRLSERTRFWIESGFSFDIGPQGASLNFASLSSLLRGGLSFDTVVSGGAQVEDGHSFDIYEDREAAVASLFTEDDGNAPRLNVTAVFEDNVAGLATGAEVELRGLTIGEVVDLSGQVDAERFGDDRVRLIATLSIRLDQIAMGDDGQDRDEVLDFLENRVAEGLRARLTNASIFSGGLKVELVEVERPEPAVFERDAVPFPILPTAPAETRDVAGAAQGLIARVSNLPVEDVLQNAVAFLESARGLVEDGAIQRASGEVVGLVEDVRAVVGSEQIQALPTRLADTLDGLEGALEEARAVVAEVRAEGTVATLTTAIEQAGGAAAEVGTAIEGVPALVERLDAIALQVQQLALQELVDQAGGTLSDARAVLSSEATRALPGQLGTALDELSATVTEARGVITELRTQGTVASLTEAVEAAGQAAGEVGTAVEGIPALVEELEAVAAKAGSLALEELVDQAGGVLADARAVVSTEEARALPGQLGTALDELSATVTEARGVITELRTQGTVASLTEAVEAAGVAAGEVGTAVEGIPALVEELEAVAAKAGSLALEELVDQAGGVLADARTVISTEEARALPGQLGEALDALSSTVVEARAVIADLEEQNSVGLLNDALEAASEAANDVSESVADVPALIERIDAVAARAETIEVEQLLDEISALAAAARGVLATEGARVLPERIGSALEEVESAVAELRAGGTVENVNQTLASARRAADSVAATAEDLPALVDRTASVLAEAERTLATLGEAGALNREARAALREVSRAADAVRSLSRAIERRPNSLLTGR